MLILFFCARLEVRAQDTVFSSASWIGLGYSEGIGKRAVPVFRKSFVFKKAVRSASLSITALGLYEAELNGRRVGDAYFTPGFTDYSKRLQYQVYDVSVMLKKSNQIKVSCGEGWYRGVFRNLSSDKARNNYGAEAGVLLELAVVFDDGTHETVVSDGSWQCAPSGIRYSELYDGEMFDSGFVISDWKDVRVLDRSKSLLVPTLVEPVRRQESFSAVKILMTPKGERVVDFGQNLAGWVQLRVKGRAGDTVRIFHGEMLDSAGNFYTGNLRTAAAVDTYILSGREQVLEPHFTYHGFRYARVVGMRATRANCRAVVLYSDMRRTGTFSCSDPLINRLQQNIEWSMKGNFVDIPTDCPQRSERLGWTGDAQVFCATAGFLFDVRHFYGKWLKDLAFAQGRNGAVPRFVPTSSPSVDINTGVAGWGDAGVMMPWELFRMYGDTSALGLQYPSMKRWVDYMRSVSPDGLFLNDGYGDWYAMGEQTSIPFIDQCFYVNSVSLLVKAAAVLGKKEDAAAYGTLYEKIHGRFLSEYGRMDTRSTSTQSAYVLALAFDLLPEGQRAGAAALLAERIAGNGNRLATGFLGTPYLLGVLSRYGYSKLAYALLMQRDCPSWLYPVTKGATTIWERWDAVGVDGKVQPVSFNHYAYGAVGRWLYENVAGIRAVSPGYRSFVVRPEIGGGLSWARGSYDTGHGMIVSSWKLDGVKVRMNVEVPSGTTAEVFVPGEVVSRKVGPGRYRFTGSLKP